MLSSDYFIFELVMDCDENYCLVTHSGIKREGLDLFYAKFGFDKVDGIRLIFISFFLEEKDSSFNCVMKF